MKINSVEEYKDGSPMAWEGEFEELVPSDELLEEHSLEIEELGILDAEGIEWGFVRLVRAPAVDESKFGGPGDSIFLSEASGFVPGQTFVLYRTSQEDDHSLVVGGRAFLVSTS